jgi:hypothetical protein
MSAVTLEDEIKQLVIQLTPIQKLKLIEWLGATLAHDLSAPDHPTQHNGHTTVADVEQQVNGVSIVEHQEERAWTPAEVQVLKKPMPKTGAELVAWIEANPYMPDEEQDADNWVNVDINDVAAWVHDLRRRPRKTGA